MRKRKVKNFNGVYGEVNAGTSTFYASSEAIKDRSESYAWQIEPHVHPNLYQFFFVESGEVTIETASGNYTAASHSVICVSPGSVHGFVFSPGLKGRVTSVSDTVIEEVLQRVPHVLLLLTGAVIVQGIGSGAVFNALNEFTFRIQDEQRKSEPEREMAVRAWLQLTLVTLYRVLKSPEDTTNRVSRNEQYFISFQNSIKSSATFSKSVRDYADELNITSVHLNRICHDVAGKTATWLVQEHVVREAQKLLRYTTLSISEIAYQLNFTAPGYFARLFKKHTGETPEAYRKLA